MEREEDGDFERNACFTFLLYTSFTRAVTAFTDSCVRFCKLSTVQGLTNKTIDVYLVLDAVHCML